MDHTARPIDLADLVDQVQWPDTVDSTNRYLAAEPPSSGSRVVATWNQTAGSGRLGRAWLSPPGQSLALSLELGPQLTPEVPSESWRGALPLLVGTHLAQAIGVVTDNVEVKWPNDVLIAGQKVAGILGEIPQPGRVIVGVGLNVWLGANQLPTPNATSLALHGLTEHTHVDTVVRGFLGGLLGALRRVGNAVTDQDWTVIRDSLGTLGQRVSVSYPDARVVNGLAVDLDDQGRLIVRTDTGQMEVVSAGDIEHLRSGDP